MVPEESREFNPPEIGRRDIAAARFLQAGAIAVVVVATVYKLFELDRFFVPKELVLNLTAGICGLLVLPSFRRSFFTRVDFLLIAFLFISAISTVTATNHWLGMRALCVSTASIAIFWSARALRLNGLARPVLIAIACAVVIGAITSLLQAYGVRTDLFSINRAPGGTLGNRNFVAHLAAFGLPVVLATAFTAKRTRGWLLGAAGAALVVAVLVLTRSRGAWLAFAAALAVFFVAVLASRPLRTSARMWSRLGGTVALVGAAVFGAMTLPNTLRWNDSSHPYLQSMRSVANYQEGSGHGRLVQYKRSLRMATKHGLLGVGPGNWAVAYPKHAARNDPSLSHSEGGMTANPWPSSDWVAYISERGFIGGLLLLAAFAVIAFQTLRRLISAQDAEEAMSDATLLAVLTATFAAGVFDAVLLLALPSLLVWTTLGLLWQPATTQLRPARAGALAVVSVIALIGAARNVAQIIGMAVYETTTNITMLQTASLIDPGSYDLHMYLSRALGGKKHCRHARAAHALYPNSGAARAAQRGCNK